MTGSLCCSPRRWRWRCLEVTVAPAAAKELGEAYDERQKRERLLSFRLAGLVLMGYLAVDAVIVSAWQPWAEPGVDILLGFAVMLAVYCVRSTVKDACLPLGREPKSRAPTLVVTVLNLVNIYRLIGKEEEPLLLRDGMVTGFCALLAFVLMTAILFAAEIWGLAKERRGKKDGDGA